MHELDDNARRVGAVNTIKLENAKLRGYNTDGKGFARADSAGVRGRSSRFADHDFGNGWRRPRHRDAMCEVKIASASLSPIAPSRRRSNSRRNYASIFAGPRVLGPVARLQAIPWEEVGHPIPNCPSGSDCECHATWVEPQRSVANSGAIACAASNGLRHGLWRGPHTPLSRLRSRLAPVQSTDCDAVASGRTRI